jgi:hypothetical protein
MTGRQLLVIVTCLLAMLCPPTTQADTPIRSEAQLARYVRDSAGTDSPLAALSSGARNRFLDSLQFGERGLVSFATEDLSDELTHAQIVALLSLFDAGQYADGLPAREKAQVPRKLESAFERRFDAFYRGLHATPPPGPQQLAEAYPRLLDGDSVRNLGATLDSHDLGLLYRATLRLPSQDFVSLDDARVLLDALDSRGEATTSRIVALFDALVEARRFDSAERLAADFPAAGIERLPLRNFAEDAEAHPNAMLWVSEDGSEMSRTRLELDKDLHIVVVAGCHFAKDAVTAISANPELESWFHAQATWLAPQGETLAEVAAWNRQFPRQPIQIAWRQAEWPQINSWAMPTFYVFRDGRLLEQWQGWAPDSGMQQLRQHLASVAERSLSDVDPEARLIGVAQLYAVGEDARGDAAASELALQGIDLTGLGWAWIHNDQPERAQERMAGIRKALQARYDSLPPEQQVRARLLLCDERPDCDPHASSPRSR